MQNGAEHYPLWKVDISEGVYEKDSDYYDADSEPDIRKSRSINYYSKRQPDSEWMLEYEENAGSMLYALHKAAVRLTQLQEDSYSSEIFREGKAAGFLYKGYCFGNLHWIEDQKCICGDSNDGYNDDIGEDGSVKIDLMESRVDVLKKNTLHFIDGKLYYDGKFVYTKEDFMTAFGLSHSNVEFMEEPFKRIVKQVYPDVLAAESWSSSVYFK